MSYGVTSAQTYASQADVDTMDAHRKYHEAQQRQNYGEDWRPLKDSFDQKKQGEEVKGGDYGQGLETSEEVKVEKEMENPLKRALKGFGKVVSKLEWIIARGYG